MRQTKRLNSEGPEVRRKLEIEAAWVLHTTPEHRARRVWLQRHLQAQNGRCFYCDMVVKTNLAPGWNHLRGTIDHVIATSRGGPDNEENTVAACAACNLAKADMLQGDFLRHPWRLHRLRQCHTPADRLSADPQSSYYDAEALSRGVGVRFRDRNRQDVEDIACPKIGFESQRAKPLTAGAGP